MSLKGKRLRQIWGRKSYYVQVRSLFRIPLNEYGDCVRLLGDPENDGFQVSPWVPFNKLQKRYDTPTLLVDTPLAMGANTRLSIIVCG